MSSSRRGLASALEAKVFGPGSDQVRPLTVNCSLVYADLPWWQAPAAAAADGFDRVEFWWPFEVAVPPAAEVERFTSAVGEAGVRLVALNLFQGDPGQNPAGVLSHPERAGELQEHVHLVAGIDRVLGSRLHNVLYGHRVPGLTAGAQDDTAVENLHYLSSVLPAGSTLLIEPLSGKPDSYPIRSSASAAAVVERATTSGACPTDRVGLLADLYHLAALGEDVAASLRAYLPLIRHLQVADWPGRHEPGTGSLDIPGLLSLVLAEGYAGEVAVEHQPAAW